jgi:hypothetical protein
VWPIPAWNGAFARNIDGPQSFVIDPRREC